MAGASTYEREVLFGYLRLSAIFSRCSDEQLSEVEKRSRFEQRAAGEEIVRQGDVGDEFYVVTSGRARVERDGHTVATLEPGGFFGELALFDPAPRNASVVAVERLTTLVLRRDDFSELLGTVPGIRDEVLRGMAHRLHEFDAKA